MAGWFDVRKDQHAPLSGLCARGGGTDASSGHAHSGSHRSACGGGPSQGHVDPLAGHLSGTHAACGGGPSEGHGGRPKAGTG